MVQVDQDRIMFCKTVFVCLVAGCLVQPNEALFGIDTIIENAASEMAVNSNNATQTVLVQALPVLTGLQTTLQSLKSGLRSQIFVYLSNVVKTEVNRTGGDPSKVNNCMNQNYALVKGFQDKGQNAITSACLGADVTGAISLVNTTSSFANNFTDTVVNVNNSVAAACPPSGDLLGGIVNPLCRVLVLGGIFADLALQTAKLSGYVNQATAIAESMTTTATGLQACVDDQMQQLATYALPLLSPVLQCVATV